MRHTIASVFAIVALFVSSDLAQAQFTYYWTPNNPTGSWTNDSNWFSFSPGTTHPHNAGDTVIFGNFITGGSGKTITLDAAIPIQQMNFTQYQTGAINLNTGTGGSLTLNTTNTNTTSITVDTASNNHTINANVTLAGTTTHQWNIGANRTFTVNGNIGGTRGLNKVGTGTLILNGTNNYTGATTVSAGTLRGRGSIASAVTVAAAATISAGTALATPQLTLGNGMTLNGKYEVTLFGNFTTSKLVIPAGLASLSGTSSLQVALGSGVTVDSFREGGPRSFTVIDAANGQLSGTFSTTNFTAAGFLPSEWSVTYSPATGNANLNFTPVPEPSTVLAIASLGLFAAWGVRRRIATHGIPTVA